MVFNAASNNISVILWWSVLLVEDTGVPRDTHRPVASHRQSLSHNVVSGKHPHQWDSNSQCTDCTSSSKSNYHTITTTTTPLSLKLSNIVNALSI
jgi:hypothetical protein